MEQDWIKDLKVGDEVIVRNQRYGACDEHIARVDVAQKKRIQVEGIWFSTRTGYKINDSWFTTSLHQLTEEDKERIQTEKKRKNLCYYFSTLDWKKFPVEKLVRIYKIVKED